MKKILLFFILLFITISTSHAWFMDSFSQPHLWVVPYNEVLEDIKANTLENVSIFTDDDLYRRWSNIVASIWILVIFILLVKIVLAIVYDSKNNLKKDIAVLMVLLLLSVISTPFFSWIWNLMAWSERNYKDPINNVNYTRIYIPSNKAIVVKSWYIDKETWQIVRMEQEADLLTKRKNVFKWDKSLYTEDFLGIPAKVVQTQWVSKETPTKRFSRAFYSVNVDVLFQWETWPINNLTSKLGISQCTIQLKQFSNEWKKPGSPLTFLESIGHNEFQVFYETHKSDTTKSWQVPFIVQWKEIPWTDTQIIIPAKYCNLWLYFLSNEFLSTYNWITEWKNHADIQNSMFVQWMLFTTKSNKIQSLFNSLTYTEQKRFVYVNQAIKNLYNITQLLDEKLASDENLKEIQLACWRIISDNVQENKDFKTCLKWDAFWDTTIYTKETTQKLWLMGKNKDITSWYVLTVPQNSDWNFPLYYQIELSLTDIALKWTAKLAAKTTSALYENTLWRINPDIIPFVWWIKQISWWVQNAWNYVYDYVVDIDEKQLQKEILYWTKQSKFLQNIEFWTQSWLNPQLASFQSYDLDWDWISDYEQKKYNKKDFYAYHYAKDISKQETISLLSRNSNLVNTPMYHTEKIEWLEEKSFTTFVWNNVYTIQPDEYQSKTLQAVKIDWKEYLALKWNRETIGSEKLLVTWNQVIFSTLNKWYNFKLYNANSKTKEPVFINVKESKTYNVFLQPSFNVFYYTNKELTQKKLLNDSYVIEKIGYYTSNENNWTKITATNTTTLPKWDYFYFKPGSPWKYNYFKDNGSTWETTSTFGSILWTSSNNSVDSYVNEMKSNWKIVYDIVEIYKKNSNWTKTIIWTDYLAVNEQIKNLNNFGNLLLPASSSIYAPSTNIYYYKNLSNWSLFSTSKITHYKQVNSIVTPNNSLNWYKLGTKTIENWKSIQVEECLADKCKGKKGTIEDLYLERANFWQLWRQFDYNNARILLNPKFNNPLTYTPSNQHYLPEYKKVKQICLINENKSSIYNNLFDKHPKNINLENCSLIWDHTRITDIRLQTYIQSENYFNLTSASKSFTHIYIPLTTNEYLEDFTSDRREQNFAWEATKEGSNLLKFQKVKWMKISEGDVIILKPWVVLWAYDFPYTIMVPTKIVPYLKYVKLNNLNEEVKPSKIYTTWIYSWLTSFTSFIKEWAAAKYFFWDASKVSERQKYSNFNFDKYDSRPDSLKFIEGIVPDRYFHSYYWAAYYSEAEAWTLDNMTAGISKFLLWLINSILQYRITILESLYLLLPILTFSLMFTWTRKIFTITISVIVSLLILPIVILFFVNALI